MPTAPWDGSAGCCEQDPVKRREFQGRAGLAAQHLQLLAEHQNLRSFAPSPRHGKTQQAHERSDHNDSTNGIG